MKFSIGLCLLLATSGFALEDQHPADLFNMLARQQFAVRTLMATPQARDNADLVDDCFNHYVEDQTNVVMGYNVRYTGCVRTRNDGRTALTQESASERESLLDRTNAMCFNLNSCDEKVDGLEFFQCYRDASSDSYKTMFTLNSDSSLDYTRISAKYSVIETDYTACVDEARADYAHDMDVCDETLNVCLKGGEVTTTVPPSTEAPSTAAPSTAAPSTAAPSTAAPSTAAPNTEAPSTAAPNTEAPSTAAPSTAAPSTAAPSTVAPSTAAPSTAAPSTAAPSTAVPSTAAPSTAAPSTAAPSTAAPSTAAPSTAVPSTVAPSTAAQSTAAPSTAAPSTAAPSTVEPSTAAPSTAAPSTAAPSTAAPSTVEPTTERSPEEDLFRSAPLANKGRWNLFKRFF
ncbi:cold shock-induced protein TIR1 [Drosophila ficusphila]|uniref:cold shock-induced protein TIR1 n=1 Tax=Drosophila ficusphila TaxID=30025 RepID=UPI0007E65637|nr:cold shock-induced protein TIR1 [Drosophila ficusphila]